MQFDNKISFGHVVSVVLMLGGGSAVYTRIVAQQEAISTRQAQSAAEIVSINRAADAREGRIRAVEIALAGQSSDLRSIQVGISRIEAQLEKIQPRP